MSKTRAKMLIFLVALPVAGAMALLGLRGVAEFMAAFQQGANPASIFRGAQLIIPAADEARWLPDAPDTIAAPSDAERDELIAAYWQAWRALERAYETGLADDLPTYWAGAAFTQIWLADAHELRQTDSGHKLQLTFFSDDGTIAGFDDVDFQLTQSVDGNAIVAQATASVVMTQDNGYWRVRQITIGFEPV